MKNDKARGHALFPDDVRAMLPKLYSQEHVADPVVVVKFFSPYSGATWLVTEFDGEDTMFGWADLGHGEGELGYISLRELAETCRGRLPLIERDCYWTPVPLSVAKAARPGVLTEDQESQLDSILARGYFDAGRP